MNLLAYKELVMNYIGNNDNTQISLIKYSTYFESIKGIALISIDIIRSK